MIEVLKGLLFVALGSMLGGTARFFVSGFVARRIGETFPWGTLIVNVSGAFAIGVFGALASTGHGMFAAPGPWLFAVTGFLGCYTTVSSFSLQTLTLVRQGEALPALSNLMFSLVFGLIAVTLGLCRRQMAGRPMSAARSELRDRAVLYGYVAVGSVIGGWARYLVFAGADGVVGPGLPLGDAVRQCHRLVRDRLLRRDHRAGWTGVRLQPAAAIGDDRDLRRLHHLLRLQL